LDKALSIVNQKGTIIVYSKKYCVDRYSRDHYRGGPLAESKNADA
jgi:hypothetical protein